jgi:hypothetical protein
MVREVVQISYTSKFRHMASCMWWKGLTPFSGKHEEGGARKMLCHLTFEVLEEIVLPEAKTMRNEWLGPQIQKVMESGKVREAGLLLGKRGGFFLVDIENPDELFTLFGPELYDTCRVEAHPVMSMEAAGQMFGQWAEENR